MANPAWTVVVVCVVREVRGAAQGVWAADVVGPGRGCSPHVCRNQPLRRGRVDHRLPIHLPGVKRPSPRVIA